MKVCRNCERIILFGGIERDGMTFCREECFRLAFPYGCLAIPDEVVEEIIRSIHDGNCPVCGCSGPVDAYFTAHPDGDEPSAKTWRVSCQGCEAKSDLINFRPIISLISRYKKSVCYGEPLQALEEYVRIQLPRLAAEEQNWKQEEENRKQAVQNRNNSDYDFHSIALYHRMLALRSLLLMLLTVLAVLLIISFSMPEFRWLIEPIVWNIIMIFSIVYTGCISWMSKPLFSLATSLHRSSMWYFVFWLIPLFNLFVVQRLRSIARKILTEAGYKVGFPLTDTEPTQPSEAWNIFSKLECYENIKQKYDQ